VTDARKMERIVSVFPSPADAEADTRRQYRRMTPDERVAITVELQRRYYQRRDPQRRLQRVLAVLERP
jgi:hypothetical protein